MLVTLASIKYDMSQAGRYCLLKGRALAILLIAVKSTPAYTYELVYFSLIL